MSETTNEERRREDDGSVERGGDAGGEAAEADAPATVEENEGMSTILSAETADGVQRNEGEE